MSIKNEAYLNYKNKRCSTCGVPFTCGNIDEQNLCWCNDFPAIFDPNAEANCLCSDCLKKATIKKVNEYASVLTPEEALNNKAKDLPKTNKLIEDLDYYMENGKFVFTSWYHLKRGHCCESGCRHCPYGFSKINK